MFCPCQKQRASTNVKRISVLSFSQKLTPKEQTCERFARGYGKCPSSIDVYRHIDHTRSLFFHSFCYQSLPLTTTTTSSIGAAVLSSVVRAAAALRLRKKPPPLPLFSSPFVFVLKLFLPPRINEASWKLPIALDALDVALFL